MDARIDRVTGPVNTWIVGDDDEVIVIDPGESADAVLAVVGQREVLAVICTHGHERHVAAAFDVAERDEAPVALHDADRLAWREAHAATEPDIKMEDGGIFEVADVALEVIHAPGHSPGSVGLYCEDLGVLFSGDVVSGGGPVPHQGGFDDFPRAGQLDRRERADPRRQDQDPAGTRRGDDGRDRGAAVRLLGDGRPGRAHRRARRLDEPGGAERGDGPVMPSQAGRWNGAAAWIRGRCRAGSMPCTPSRLRSWLDCPRRYRMTYLDRPRAAERRAVGA